MKKSIIVLLAGIFFLTGCQRNAVIKTHGIAYLDKREKLIIVNESNKNDTIDILGQPSSKGMTNENTWIYIERTKTRGKLLKLGRNYLKKKCLRRTNTSREYFERTISTGNGYLPQTLFGGRRIPSAYANLA